MSGHTILVAVLAAWGATTAVAALTVAFASRRVQHRPTVVRVGPDQWYAACHCGWLSPLRSTRRAARRHLADHPDGEAAP